MMRFILLSLLAACSTNANSEHAFCPRFDQLDQNQRIKVSNAETSLVQTGLAHDFSLTCISFEQHDGATVAIFSVPHSPNEEVLSRSYAARFEPTSNEVSRINLNYPRGEWEEPGKATGGVPQN